MTSLTGTATVLYFYMMAIRTILFVLHMHIFIDDRWGFI